MLDATELLQEADQVLIEYAADLLTNLDVSQTAKQALS